MTIKSFNELGQRYNRESKVGNKMTDSVETNARRKRPEFKASAKYYHHDRRFGFVYVNVPEGTTLPCKIKSAETDQEPNVEYAKGTTLDRDVIAEAFIHGSVIENAGHMRGLTPGQELIVQFEESSRGGIQIGWTKPISRSKAVNEPRPCNAALAFVSAEVKKYTEDKKFGFLIVSSDPETGKPLVDSNNEPITRDVYFNESALKRAGYDTVSEGETINVRYWTNSEGKSRVTQFQYKEKAKQQKDAEQEQSEAA